MRQLYSHCTTGKRRSSYIFEERVRDTLASVKRNTLKRVSNSVLKSCNKCKEQRRRIENSMLYTFMLRVVLRLLAIRIKIFLYTYSTAYFQELIFLNLLH